MNVLKKVLAMVVALVLLSVLKRLLDRFSPVSTVFHYNLLTCLQYFLLLALILWLMVLGIARITGKKCVKLKYCLLILLGVLAITEGYLYYTIRNAEKTTGRFHRMLVEYYLTYEINYPHLRYDTTLSYTLEKNAAYEHSNIEFSHEVRANSAGLRDDDASLIKPGIICLGDSYPMGWGVDQQHTFAEILAKKTGLKVLNAGMTSYGTARELLLLNRLDTSNVTSIVLQYCYNDRDENAEYVRNRGYLPIGSQQTMNNRFRSHQLARTYFPFKYSLTILRIYLRNKLFTNPEVQDLYPVQRTTDYVQKDAANFLSILSNSNIDFNKLDVYVIDMNRYPVFEHHMLDTVQNMLLTGNYKADILKSVHLVRFPELNNQKYFLPLDNHLNEAGHALIAEKIMEAMK